MSKDAKVNNKKNIIGGGNHLSKETQANLAVIKDKSVSNEVKVFIILEMLHSKEITLNKAREFCTEIGIFSDHWMVMDSKATEAFSEKYQQ